MTMVNKSGWTVETLKEHYDQRFIDSERAVTAAREADTRAVNAALEAAEKAVTKAEGAAEKRADSQNEFRAQLSDQAGTFMPRREAEQRMATLDEKLRNLQSRADLSAGKFGGIGWLAAAIAGLVALLVGLGTLATRLHL